MSHKSSFPPPPKLRPRPGLKSIDETMADISIATTETEIEIPSPFSLKRKRPSRSDDSSPTFPKSDTSDAVLQTKTSRLLTKSECRGTGGRKRSSGSLIHSIPKFSQVQPTGGCISQVQKVLQSRLLEKQKLQKQKTSEPNFEMVFGQTNGGAILKPDLKATNILQSIVQLHERATQEESSVSSPPVSQISPALSPNDSNNIRKRGRKPDKSAICHLVPMDTPSTSDASNISLSELLCPRKESPPLPVPFSLPKLSEVTITPATVTRTDSSKKLTRSSSPEIVELPTSRKSPQTPSNPQLSSPPPPTKPPVLKPDEYESLGMPAGYIYWPTAHVFVHLSAIPPQYLDYRGVPIFSPNPNPPLVSTPTAKNGSIPSRKVESMESMTGVMRVRPFKATAHEKSSSTDRDKSQTAGKPKPIRHEPNTEVSMCKFKFTGGAKPTLEEKKMLSVDSIGNFRYFSQQQQQQHGLPIDKRPNSNSPQTTLTEQRPSFAGQQRLPLGAIDLITAFEALPEQRSHHSSK